MALTKNQRAVLREKYGGKCAYCGCDLPARWHADHIEAVIRKCKAVKTGRNTYKLVSTDEMHRPGNDRLDNMNPSCVDCNLYKSTANIEQFRKMIMDGFRGSIHRTLSLRAAQRFGIITITPLAETDVIFWFEKYEAEQESA